MKLFNNEAPSETRTSFLSVEDILLRFFEDELRILHFEDVLLRIIRCTSSSIISFS